MTRSTDSFEDKNRPAILPSPETLIEQYAALVWKTIADYLDDPEDIKECVNDVFLAFYTGNRPYDPAKGSYASFLVAIARNKAVSRYRQNAARASHMADSSGSFPPAYDSDDIPDTVSQEDRLTEKLDLEAAMASLDPQEFDLIRMKYYDGMTIREIADTMNLPYETVKKRHQRSIGKLRRYLTLTLILLLIAAVLSACAYIILRYFGVIPGYGINTDPDTVAYILEEEVTAEDAPYTVTVKRAMLREDSLFIDIQIRNTDLPSDTEDESELLPSWAAQMESDLELMYAGEVYPHYIGQDVDYTVDSTGGTFLYSIAWNEKSELPGLIADDMNTKEALELTMTGKETGFEIPFRLTPIQDLPLERYSYVMTEFGGFMADAYIREGHLMADLYSLGTDGFKLSIINNPPLTAVSEDGTVLTGELVYWHIYQDLMRTYDFGCAEPGSYTLRADQFQLTAELPEDFCVGFDEILDSEEGAVREVPFATVHFQPEPDPLPDYVTKQEEPSMRCTFIPIEVITDRNDLTYESLNITVQYPDDLPEIMAAGNVAPYFIVQMSLNPDNTTNNEGILVGSPETYENSEIAFAAPPYDLPGSVTYIWDAPLTLPVDVKERE